MAGIIDHLQDNTPSSRKAHWEHIYSVKRPAETSWYQLHPEYSLAMIEHTGLGTGASLIDVGGGASTLADHLLAAGYRHVTVLDIAHTAIEQAKARLGKQASMITWLETDINDYTPAQPFDIWHDRAVFHFLTSETQRARYVATLNKALKPGSHAIIATFAEHGPSKCSGLDVVRYSPESLNRALGHTLRLVETRTEEHHTPNGGINYCRFIRTENQ
ncbi:MAG: class I SAM-dependent methyltransferase [Gammaproteobacteria bacterium]|nr:MAG: class I SAM-dependent methyltransferase [Gammaproteobacteria bacterium]